MKECVICWQEAPTVKLTPCEHQFCAKCLRRQLEYDARCALCRCVIASSSVDLFDSRPITHCVRISPMTRRPIGVTLVMREKLVVVQTVHFKSVAEKMGIQRGDIIVRINNLPCYSANCAQQILKERWQETHLMLHRDVRCCAPFLRTCGEFF